MQSTDYKIDRTYLEYSKLDMRWNVELNFDSFLEDSFLKKFK